MESEKVNELNRELEQRVEARTADYKQLLNKIGDGSITIVKPPEE